MRFSAGSGLLLLVISTAARAAFVNGVETFDGTVKDLTTWEQYGATFTQNNSLTIGGFGNYADYTTRAAPIGIGQRVMAEVTFSVPNVGSTIFEAGLVLTTNSRGTTSDTFHDSRFFGALVCFDTATQNQGTYFESISGANGGFGGGIYGRGVPTSGSTFVLSVGRYSSDGLAIAAYFPDGTPIFEDRHVTATPIPTDFLFVSLHRTNLGGGFTSTATFDNVAISDLPEPNSVLALGIATLLARRLRRQ